MKKEKNVWYFLHFALIIASLIIIMANSSHAVLTCFNTTENLEICHQSDSGIYPQNINLWEGQNEKHGVYITNPDDELNYNLFLTKVKDTFDNGKIDVTKLGDNTKFTFQSFDDFYNLIQQNNANGNVTLFTRAELNQELRNRNVFYTSEVLQWTTTMFIVIMELLKITFSIIIIIGAMYLFFRLIPFGLKKINIMVFKFALGGKKK